MTDTGEQGLKPKDPADSAGVGGGVVPDDQTDGQEQAAEFAEQSSRESATGSGDTKDDD